MSDESKRAESGVVVFGDDWPGLFLRGDDALMFGVHLRDFLKGYPKNGDDAITIDVLEGLAETLLSVNVSLDDPRVNLKGFEDCKAEE